MMKYNGYDHISDQEMQILDNILEYADETEQDFSSLEAGVLEKINVRKRSKKRILLPLIAAAILVLSMAVYGATNGWDEQLAGRFGLDNRETDLQDGYTVINVSDKHNEIVFTAVEAIGDDMSQWIRVDTNIPWEDAGAGKGTAYLPYDWNTNITNRKGKIITGSGELESFNNEGYVSYWLALTGVKGMNRASVELEFGDIQCSVWDEKSDEEISRETIDDHTYTLNWQNDYKVGVRKFKVSDSVMLEFESGNTAVLNIRKIEITPVTIYMKGTAKNDYFEDAMELDVSHVRMRDGKLVEFEPGDITAECTGGVYKDHISYYITINNDKCKINGNDITGIVIAGKEVSLE